MLTPSLRSHGSACEPAARQTAPSRRIVQCDRSRPASGDSSEVPPSPVCVSGSATRAYQQLEGFVKKWKDYKSSAKGGEGSSTPRPAMAAESAARAALALSALGALALFPKSDVSTDHARPSLMLSFANLTRVAPLGYRNLLHVLLCQSHPPLTPHPPPPASLPRLVASTGARRGRRGVGRGGRRRRRGRRPRGRRHEALVPAPGRHHRRGPQPPFHRRRSSRRRHAAASRAPPPAPIIPRMKSENHGNLELIVAAPCLLGPDCL